MTTRAALSSVALVALFAGLAGRVSAQDTNQANAAKGTALMAEARKAIGGEDKLRGVKTVQVNGKFKRTAGANTLEGDFEVYIEPPGKYKRHEETGSAGGPIGERTEVLNGAETWDETSNGFPAGRGFFGRGRPGGAPDGATGGDGAARQGGQAGGRGGQPIDPERLKDLQRRQRLAELTRLMLVWFLTTDAPVSWVGTAESPDGNADVIEVKPTEGNPTRVFLDSATHMPLMLTTTGFGGRGRRGGGPGGQGGDAGRGDAGRGGAPPQIAIETHLSEYKTVGGIKLPHLITRGVNGQTNEEWEIKTYRINPNFKANTFTK
jgi:outer membrane lipoprotein-sorting protein